MLPEVNLARRLVKRYRLTPPVDIFKLTESYSSIQIEYIPFEIDGISLNLKVPGKKPHIILNNQTTKQRMRFTLAHELGHILIPWHIGTIIDVTEESKSIDPYWETEAEANRFASELLMPSDWVTKTIKIYRDLETITNNIVNTANVSSQAATISMVRNLSPGYICALINENNKIIFSGKSKETKAKIPEWGTTINPEHHYFNFAKNQRFIINGNIFVWWIFENDVKFNDSYLTDSRGWREILGKIINEIGIPYNKQEAFKRRLNGIIAYANGLVHGKERTTRSIYSACLQRLCSFDEMKKFIAHPEFNVFLVKKASDLRKK